MPTRLSATQAILYGTLVVGTLDGLDAIVFFWLVEALEREMGLPVRTPGSVTGLLVFVVTILGLVGWWWLRP